MPVVATITPRNEATPLPALSPIQSTTPKNRGNIIAGIIIGIIASIFLVLFSINTGISWYNRVRKLRTVRNNVIMDQEAGIGTPHEPSQELPQELRQVAPITVGSELHSMQDNPPAMPTQSHEVQDIPEIHMPQSNHSTYTPEPTIHESQDSSSKNSDNSNCIKPTELTNIDVEPFPTFDPTYRASLDDACIPNYSVRESHVSADTVDTTDTDTTMGTTISIGTAVPMRMTLHNTRHVRAGRAVR
jgi:hypothetical protein